jgi:hypothetical protein
MDTDKPAAPAAGQQPAPQPAGNPQPGNPAPRPVGALGTRDFAQPAPRTDAPTQAAAEQQRADDHVRDQIAQNNRYAREQAERMGNKPGVQVREAVSGRPLNQGVDALTGEALDQDQDRKRAFDTR